MGGLGAAAELVIRFGFPASTFATCKLLGSQDLCNKSQPQPQRVLSAFVLSSSREKPTEERRLHIRCGFQSHMALTVPQMRRTTGASKSVVKFART
jgi:hypothetical protein